MCTSELQMDQNIQISKKKIKRLIISQQDVFASANFAYQLLKYKYHDPDYLENFEEFSNSDEYTNMEALTIALIISYSRPFTDNKGWETAIPTLPKKCLQKFDKSEKELHLEVLKRRNKAVGHSDADLYEAYLSASEKDKYVFPVVMNSQIIFFTKNELLKLQAMIEKIINYLGEAVNSLIKHHGDDFFTYLVEK